MRSVRERFAVLPRATRLRFVACSLLSAALLGAFALYTLPRLQYETDLLALLPHLRGDREVGAAVDKFSQTMAGRMMFLVAADEVADAKAAADRFAAALQISRQFADVQWRFGGGIAEQVALYRAHVSGLLSERDAQWLREGAHDKLYRQALRQALTPAGLMRPVGLSEDPLGLLSDFIMAQAPAIGNAQLDGEHLTIRQQGRAYVLVVAECAGSPFASDYQAAARAAIEVASAAARATILESGALQHAEAAAERAQSEIALFGALSTAAMLVLVLLVLRGIAPIVLSAAVLIIALAAALAVTHWIFGRVHLLALVFGSSLVGVVIDYSLHFLVDRYRQPAQWSGADALRHVGPSLLWGCLATICGYAALMLVPLPGLRQIALFCFVGSLTGCLAVLCLYPVLVSDRAAPSMSILRIANRIEQQLQSWRLPRGTSAVGMIVALVLAIGGCWQLKTQDDLRSLQSSTGELLARERQVQTVLGTSIESGFFVVRGATQEATLQAEEALVAKLNGLTERHALTSFIALSRAIPSLATQEANRRLMQTQVWQAGGPLERILASFGYESQAIVARRSVEASTRPLDFAQWLDNSASRPYRQFWLGRFQDRYASVVTVAGIHDLGAVAKAVEGLQGVTWVDRVAEMSSMLRTYRIAASWMWGAIVAIILLVLSARFRFGVALRAALPSIVASVTTIAVFGWFGWPVNLFVVLAMLLVLALGIDYGLVLMNSRDARGAGIISVSLSAITTSFSFGLLSFSSMGFIASIGLGLSLGIALTCIFSLLWCRSTPQVSI